MKFIEFLNVKKEDPILLIVDGHSSHIKNLPVIDVARENRIILLYSPSHCILYVLYA
jgi:hypothetical protein